jgi:hypothetical protein
LSGQALGEVPTRRRQLKYRHRNGSVFQNFRPHMQNLYEKVSPEKKLQTDDQSEVRISLTASPESNNEERDIMVDAPIDVDKFKGDRSVMVCKNRSISEEALSRSSDAQSAGSSKGYNSEVEIYVDALTTMDSEVETDTEHRDHGHRPFARMDNGNTYPDVHNAVPLRSSSFEKEDILDVASANRDTNDQHDEVSVSTPQDKPVPGEHERTSSLEELFEQEKPGSCDHERTSSLEDLLTEDVHASGEQVTEWSCNGTVSNAVSNGTQDITNNAKEAKENSNIATISFKKIASKRSKYVGGMELIASKVGILPRKLSKKHDPFSDSLRSMAKQLLELKYDSTQHTGSYGFEADGEGYDVKCLEMYNPPVEINKSDMQRTRSGSPHDDISLRECHQEEVNHESEHDVPPTDSPQDSVPGDGNGFEDSNIHYLISMASPVLGEEEVCAGAECDEHSTTVILNHKLKHSEEKIVEHADNEVAEDIPTEVTSENASNTGEDLKEISICAGRVNAQDIDENNEYDIYASDDDESMDHIEEPVVSDGMISSLVSSKQSDDPYQITPLIPTDADDTMEFKETGRYTPEADNITLRETLTGGDLTKVVSKTGTASEAAAMPDNEQYNLHSEGTVGQNTVVSSYGVGCQIEQLPINSSAMQVPDSTVKAEVNHVFHCAVHQETPNSGNSSAEVFGDPPTPNSRDVPVPIISSFNWMLNSTMQKSLNILPSQQTNGNVQANGSTEDTQDPPPVPPLPPMQWRTNKLQTGSSVLSEKTGRPPRPKPPVKRHVSDDNSSLDVRNEAAVMVQESSLHNGLSLQNEMAQVMDSNEPGTNQQLVNKESLVKNAQQGGKEYDIQDSNLFSPTEVTCVPEVASVKYETELIIIPEEAWSEFGDMKLIAEQDRKHQLSFGDSGCNGMQASGLSTEKTIEKHQHKEKEFSAAGSKKLAEPEENKPNGAPKQDDMLNPDSPGQQAQQDDGGYCGSGEKSREFSSVLEEEPESSPAVPKPPRYPVLPVTSHDRSMVCMRMTYFIFLFLYMLLGSSSDQISSF